jgi:WD40 repeat protein
MWFRYPLHLLFTPIQDKCAFHFFVCLLLFTSALRYQCYGQASAPELVLQRGHNTGIIDLKFSRNSRSLITIDGQGDAKLWDLSSRREIRTLVQLSTKFSTLRLGPTERLNFRDLPISTVFSSDDSWVALGSLNSPISIWRVADGTRMRTLAGSEGMIGLALNRTGTRLAGRSEAGAMIVWDTNSWEEEKKIANGGPAVNALELFGDPRTLYSASRSVAFSPNGDLLRAVDRNRNIRRWDTASWQEEVVTASEKLIYSILDFDSLGDLIVTADFGNSLIQVWDASKGNLRTRINCHKSGATLVRLSDDGHLLATATGNGELTVWDALKGKELYKTNYPMGFPMGAMTALEFNDDASKLAVGTANGTADIYERESADFTQWRKVYTLSGIASIQYSPAFSKDCNSIVVADTEGSIKSWNLIRGRQAVTHQFSLAPTLGVTLPLVVYITNDGDHFMMNNFQQVEIGTLSNGEMLGRPTIIPLDPMSTALTLSNDGKILVAAAADGLLTVWDVPSKTKVIELRHPEKIVAGAFSLDNRLLCVGSLDGAVYLYYFDEQRRLTTLQRNAKLGAFKLSVVSMKFSPLGHYLAVSSTDGTIKIWKLGDLSYLDLPAREELPNSVFSFTPDETKLLISSADRKVLTWDVQHNKFNGVAFEVASNVTSFTFDRTGHWLLITSEDGMVRLLETKNWNQLVTLASLKHGQWLATTRDGLFDGTADAMRQVSWRIGNTNEVVPLDSFYNDFYHPGLLAELAAGETPKAIVDISSLLQLPGLRAMLRQGLVRIEKRGGKQVLCVDDKPTALPTLFSDAQPLAFDVNDLTFDADDSGCSYQKILPPSAQLELTNVASQATTESFKPAYDKTKSETAEATLHMFTVGVGSYDFSTSGFKRLPSSVLGSKEVEKFFTDPESPARNSFRNIRVWPGLYDIAATREAIRQRLREMAKVVKSDDVVLLFFSGHGVVPAGQEMFFFAPIDMRGPSPQDQRETGLNTAMLAEALEDLPARRVVLLVDACQSGGAIESLGKIGQIKAKLEMRRATLENSQSAARRHEVGIYIIAAATPLQDAVQPKNGNGALVTSFLESLRDAAQQGDGEVWMREVTKHIERRLPEISAQIGQRHTPMIVSLGLDFALAKTRVH